MNKLKILVSPNPLLKQVSKQVRFPLDQQTESNIKHLKNTFRDSFTQCQTRTLGLAAPQIGILQRFFIMPNNMNYPDVSLNVLKSIVRKFNVYINPQILEKSQNQVKIVEQCLSIGSKIYYDVERSQSVRVLYFNHRGQSIEQNLTGIKARVFLHQYDHLNGVTMDQRGNLIKRNNSVDKQLHMAIKQDSELFEQKAKQKL